MGYLILAVLLCALVFAGCVPAKEEQTPGMEEMERVSVYLPDFEEEWKTDYKAFYEKYKDVVVVVENGEVTQNHLGKALHRMRIGQGGDGRYAAANFLFDEETEELINLPGLEGIAVEGIVKQPRTKNSPKPLNLEIEHCKMLNHWPYVNPMLLPFDITPAFEETKAALLEKYPFVTNIEFSTKRVGTEGSVIEGEDLYFVTDVKEGTDPKEVLAYAEYGTRLLNENARKIDDTLAPSTGDSYGGLYKRNHMSVWVRPEGVVEAHHKYYIFDAITARVGDTMKLTKAYRQ